MEPRDAARDADIGLTGFLTTTPPLGGRLKVHVEDFIVEEVGGLPAEDPNGRYTCAVVRLSNWETNQFVRTASDRLHVSRKKIRFSGTKDKRGVTTQVFSFEAPAEEVQALSRIPGVEIERVWRTRQESALGDHSHNAFRVVVRDVEGPAERIRAQVQATWDEALAAGGFPNVFGPQRFGALRATTHRVGERILQGDFRGAVHAYLAGPPPRMDAAAGDEWRRRLEAGDYAGLLSLATGDLGFERALLHRLAERPDDPVDALLALPANLQLLFVYAYQSYLFNRIVSRRLERGLVLGRAVVGDLVAPVEDGEMELTWVPVRESNLERANEEIARGRAALTGLLPGTEAPLAEAAPGEIERSVLAEAGATRSTFVVPEHLEWSSKGTRRALTLRPEGFAFVVAPDELHAERFKLEVAFQLPRGAYATSVLREFLKSPRLLDYA